jgi:hypothetical protein
MGNNPVVYVDPDGREAILLATVVIKATIKAAVIAKTAATVTTAASAAYMASQMAPMVSNTLMPPDGYLYDPSRPGELQWQNFDGRGQGVDFITNTQTDQVFTRPMHQHLAMKPPTAELGNQFGSLADPMRTVYPFGKMPSLPAGPLGPTYGAPALQGGVSSLGPTPAAAIAGGGFNPTGLLFAGGGGIAAMGAYSYYNPKTQNWWSTSQQRYYNGNNFIGNQHTNNGMRGAMGMRNAFRGVGYGLGALQYGSTIYDYRAGHMNDYQFGSELISTSISTFPGIPGAAWGIGWDAGRAITSIPWYHKGARGFRYRVFG